jgi:hypothetical protein
MKIKITERGKIDTPNTQIHDRSLSYLGKRNSNKKWRGLKVAGLNYELNKIINIYQSKNNKLTTNSKFDHILGSLCII